MLHPDLALIDRTLKLFGDLIIKYITKKPQEKKSSNQIKLYYHNIFANKNLKKAL